MKLTLGRVLKGKRITQIKFRQILNTKYNHSVNGATVSGYCSKECPSSYPCWEVVKKCLKEHFNIEYKNGRWQEVNENGN